MSITSTVTVTETIDIIEMSITSTVTEVDQSMSITSTITETTPTAKADKKPAQNTEDV
jgi:glutathione synthase/RimK-type ligase-like ATP-grasp enzyme